MTDAERQRIQKQLQEIDAWRASRMKVLVDDGFGIWLCVLMSPRKPSAGIPTAGLLAHVVVSKYLDHLPL